MKFIILIGIVVIIALQIYKIKNAPSTDEEATKETKQDKQPIYPYQKKYLLTKNEYYFYKKLKKITDEHNLQILAKIRLADLLDVKSGLNKKEWNIYFSKIKSKHIDFAVADDMKILFLIELDDSSHNAENRIKRDDFVKNALTEGGYKLLRTYGNLTEIENEIKNSGITSTPIY